MRKMTSKEDFTNALVNYYHIYNIPQDKIDAIMSANSGNIETYLTATPELMARKFYEWTFDEELH